MQCEGYDYEEFPDEIMEVTLTETFFTRSTKMLSRSDGLMLHFNLGVDFFSTSDILYPNVKADLLLARSRPSFYMIYENPNVSLGNVDCSLYTRRFAVKDHYHRKRMEMLAYELVE